MDEEEPAVEGKQFQRVMDCLIEGKLLNPPNWACYQPLDQTPCFGPDEWFRLDSWQSG